MKRPGNFCLKVKLIALNIITAIENILFFYYLDNIEMSEPKKDKPNTIQMFKITL